MKAETFAATKAPSPPPVCPATTDPGRTDQAVREHYSFVWRSLRRLGVAQQAVDDTVQRVFEVFSQRIDSIGPGAEKAFLFQTALRVAMSLRRDFAQRREVIADDLDDFVDPTPQADALTEERRRRAMLDVLLASLPDDQRAVFVLFELEELGTREIAEMLDLPEGTVASRLRRARELFSQAAHRLRARMKGENP